MESTFNLPHFWSQGDGFTHFTAIVLLIMSILTWGVIFLRFSMFNRLRQMSRGLIAFWQAREADSQIAALAAFDR